MVWANMRHRNRRVVIALPDFTYAVILAGSGRRVAKTPSKADIARERTTSLHFLRVVDEPS